jgi:hypothetical protein
MTFDILTNELKQYLDGEALDQAKTPLQLALEQLSDDIRRSLTCPISGDIMQGQSFCFCPERLLIVNLYALLAAP